MRVNGQCEPTSARAGPPSHLDVRVLGQELKEALDAQEAALEDLEDELDDHVLALVKLHARRLLPMQKPVSEIVSSCETVIHLLLALLRASPCARPCAAGSV